MTRAEIVSQIRKKKSFLCVGLDPDLAKLPSSLKSHPDPVFEFCKSVVDATEKYSVAYKPNSAFFEALGSQGWDIMDRIIKYIRKNYPEQFVIADAKRGDIGNTSAMYAKAFLKDMGADAVTVAPYMGEDSVKPFLLPGKWAVVLALTSNPGSADFQIPDLYKKVLQVSSTWGSMENMMFVVGATQAAELGKIRMIIPDHFLLIPGVGTQGGDLKEVAKYGMNREVGILINASRSILYASGGNDYAVAAATEASRLQEEMSALIR